MNHLIVVDRPEDWKINVKGVAVVAAKHYLTAPDFRKQKSLKVYNLCRCYRYQSTGYYVSLLAEARGHNPLPSVATIQDLKSQCMVRLFSGELHEMIQQALAPIRSHEFVLSIYFGRNMAKRYDRISSHLYSLFQSPLLRARFRRDDEKVWHLQTIKAIPASEVPEEHYHFAVQSAESYFSGKRLRLPKRRAARYNLAILHNPDEGESPSNARALQKFVRAAVDFEIGAELVTKDDFDSLAEFDALFIRETTSVNHHTYRFARKAEAEGLVVIDDPKSILRCANKVYLNEILTTMKLPTPRTQVLSRDNEDEVLREIGLPCILKRPDSSFSQGVLKAEGQEAFYQHARDMLSRSDLIIAQEFLPTEFDWRIGVLNREILFACKYYMAKNHWQIIKTSQGGQTVDGQVICVELSAVPPEVKRVALKAANLVGDGLYGVDLKQINGRTVVIEINDNPNIDSGFEDAVLKDELYNRIMVVFANRIEDAKRID